MTDETVVVDGGAPAPAEVPINPEQVHVPDPVTGRPAQEQVEEQPSDKTEKVDKAEKPEKPKKAASIDDALKNALDKAAKKKGEAEDKAREAEQETKPEAKEAAEGKPEGQEKPERNVTDYADPPSRFHDGAKSKWLDAPVEVRGEVDRLTKELEQGIQKYKTAAEQYDRLKEFDDTAKQNGRDLRESLTKITEIERAFAQNPITGLDMVLRELGAKKADGSPVTLLDIASHVMGQKPEERAMQQNSTIASLQSEIAQLKQQVSGFAPVVQQVQTESNERALKEWASDKPHFDKLRAEVTEYVKQGVAPDDAYQRAVSDFQEKAKAFGFSATPEPLTPAPDQTGAHTPEPARPLKPAGQKSVTGSPSTTATPVKPKKGPAPSIDEALERAMRKAS